MDWQFRITDLNSFAADLDAFCTQYGWPLLTQPATDPGAYWPYETMPGPTDRTVKRPYIGADVRVDFDLIENLVTVPEIVDSNDVVVTAAVTKGPHINGRATSLSPNGSAVISQLDSELSSYFGALGTTTNTVPSQYGGGTQTFHTTGKTMLVAPVAVPKRVWC